MEQVKRTRRENGRTEEDEPRRPATTSTETAEVQVPEWLARQLFRIFV